MQCIELQRRPANARTAVLLVLCMIGSMGGFVFQPKAAAAPSSAGNPIEKIAEVRIVLDMCYDTSSAADQIKHTLDLFLPKDKKDFPVILFIHGGAWVHGDKRGFFGTYPKLAKTWAEHGIGCVVINYRLSPGVRHPEHIRDVAKAFAWTHKHIGKYGGRADQIIVCGHSAGGHLASLLATDETYLKAEGLTVRNIRGVIPVSGVYQVPTDTRVFDMVFGKDAKVRLEASPIYHVKPGLPPFLIIYADNDLDYCGCAPSEEFCRAILAKKCVAQTLEVKKRNHLSVLMRLATENDPAALAMDAFIQKCLKE